MNTQYLHKQLATWYGSNHRILPWRETSDPYRIWLSEIILQQTRVAQGYDYYLRFIERFPDVMSLAAASEDEVMLLWQGLGYYSRARNLHKAAREVAERYGGVFPPDYAAVRALSGVGDYTAAAVCSFAWNMPYAVVDGNVYRLLSRLTDDDTPIDTTNGRKRFQALADRLLDPANPRLHNQTMMELGALVCTPQNPQCSLCPIVSLCKAEAAGTAALLPVKGKSAPLKDRYLTYIIYKSSNHTLLCQRHGKDIWQHLYEFPLLESDRLLEAGELGLSPLWQADFVHILSHQRLHARFFLASVASLPQQDGTFPVAWSSLSDYALSRLTLRALETLPLDL